MVWTKQIWYCEKSNVKYEQNLVWLLIEVIGNIIITTQSSYSDTCRANFINRAKP